MGSIGPVLPGGARETRGSGAGRDSGAGLGSGAGRDSGGFSGTEAFAAEGFAKEDGGAAMMAASISASMGWVASTGISSSFVMALPGPTGGDTLAIGS